MNVNDLEMCILTQYLSTFFTVAGSFLMLKTWRTECGPANICIPNQVSSHELVIYKLNSLSLSSWSFIGIICEFVRVHVCVCFYIVSLTSFHTCKLRSRTSNKIETEFPRMACRAICTHGEHASR